MAELTFTYTIRTNIGFGVDATDTLSISYNASVPGPKGDKGDTGPAGPAPSGTGVVKVASGVVTAGTVDLGNMTALAANSIIGNNTGSSATPVALTVAQTNAMLGTATVADGLTQFAPITSAQWRTELTDPTGTGSSVFATSPTLTTPIVANVAAGNVAFFTTGGVLDDGDWITYDAATSGLVAVTNPTQDANTVTNTPRIRVRTFRGASASDHYWFRGRQFAPAIIGMPSYNVGYPSGSESSGFFGDGMGQVVGNTGIALFSQHAPIIGGYSAQAFVASGRRLRWLNIGTQAETVSLVDASTGVLAVRNGNGVGDASLTCRNLTASGTVTLGVFTVGTLPTAVTNARATAFALDSSLPYTSANIGSTVTAGGSNLVPVWCNGTNWVIG